MGIPFFIPFVSKEDEKAVIEALRSRWLTLGPRVSEFEKRFAEYIGVKYAVSVGNCTEALHLCMKILDLKRGDEVIVPTLTFVSTANCVMFVGAKPVLADIDEKTFNISPESVLEKITPKTKAIIPVHYAGQCCDMKEIVEIAEDHKLHIIEDCAHALGSIYNGNKAGSFGVAGCFSFYPTKCITTGEGGMITTNDEKIEKKAKLLRNHCMTKSAFERERSKEWYYDIIDLGYNYRMSELQAALGISQLRKLNKLNEMRIRNAEYLTERLKKVKGIIPPFHAKKRNHIYHLYVVKIDKEKLGITRDEVFKYLVKKGIGCSVHYTPIHRFSFYKRFFKLNPKEFPTAEKIYKQILSLPMYPSLKKTQIDFIVNSLKEITGS